MDILIDMAPDSCHRKEIGNILQPTSTDFKEYPSLFNISLSLSSPGDVSYT